jgi:hypothetical protein
MGKNSVVRRIAPEMDSEIRRLQAFMMQKENKNVKYLEASRTYAITSFNGKTDIVTALRKMDRL